MPVDSNARSKSVPQDVIEDMSMLRTTGDILADELSVLRHTTGITGNALDALKDWDALSFKLRNVLRELEIG